MDSHQLVLGVRGSLDNGSDELVHKEEDLDTLKDVEEDEEDRHVLDPAPLDHKPETRSVSVAPLRKLNGKFG